MGIEERRRDMASEAQCLAITKLWVGDGNAHSHCCNHKVVVNTGAPTIPHNGLLGRPESTRGSTGNEKKKRKKKIF